MRCYEEREVSYHQETWLHEGPCGGAAQWQATALFGGPAGEALVSTLEARARSSHLFILPTNGNEFDRKAFGPALLRWNAFRRIESHLYT